MGVGSVSYTHLLVPFNGNELQPIEQPPKLHLSRTCTHALQLALQLREETSRVRTRSNIATAKSMSAVVVSSPSDTRTV